jgi:hypothetical protein
VARVGGDDRRVADGETLITDGPFVAVKKAVGGYLFFEAENLDAAIELAARIPAAQLGAELRRATDPDRRARGSRDAVRRGPDPRCA